MLCREAVVEVVVGGDAVTVVFGFERRWMRMALDLLCQATMMYWLPLRARGVKRPVSSVNIWLMGMVRISSVGVVADVLVGVVVGVIVFRVDRMCWRGCAMCPRKVSSASGQ